MPSPQKVKENKWDTPVWIIGSAVVMLIWWRFLKFTSLGDGLRLVGTFLAPMVFMFALGLVLDRKNYRSLILPVAFVSFILPIIMYSGLSLVTCYFSQSCN